MVKNEITNLENPVFAGQILAEMLGGVCHPEFYKYSAQEVLPYPFDCLITIGIRHLHNTHIISTIPLQLPQRLSPFNPRHRRGKEERQNVCYQILRLL